MIERPPFFFQSLVKPYLFAGAEREASGVVIGTGLGLIAMAWQFLSLYCLILGLVFLMVGVPLIQHIAKRDPKMFAVYRRYITYREYYPAHSTPFRDGPLFPGAERRAAVIVTVTGSGLAVAAWELGSILGGVLAAAFLIAAALLARQIPKG